MSKVFGIGLQRTGTTSLRYAFERLGLSCKRDGGVWELVNVDSTGQLAFNPEALELRAYQAFTDNPIPVLFKVLDQYFPQSRFIMTQRSLEGWLKSVAKLFDWGMTAWDQMPEGPLIHATHRALYGTTEFDSEKFSKTYKCYYQDVENYFTNRPQDLLVMNFEEGDGWDKLCPFLQLEVPEVEFPHKNKT